LTFPEIYDIIDFTRTKVQNLICSLNPYLASNLPLLGGRVQSPLPLPAAAVGELDSAFEDDIERSLPDEESDEEEESVPEANIQIRAQHNGYHSESKKLL